MDFSAAIGQGDEPGASGIEQRAAPRFVSLIRAAKLACAQGEFVCVIRDVSSTGVSLRTFHQLPSCSHVALELQNGESFELHKVRGQGREASFSFPKPIEVERLVQESWKYPKRQLRLNIAIPLTVTTLAGRFTAVTGNLSQQGARIECDAMFAIDQMVRIEGGDMPEIRAKVRWRKDNTYGMVFDNTFTLRDFALVAALMQSPTLVSENYI